MRFEPSEILCLFLQLLLLVNEAVVPTWIANNQWAKSWVLSWQWTWCFWLGCHYLYCHWPLVALIRPFHCSCSSTSPHHCIWFLDLVHSTSSILRFTPFFLPTPLVKVLVNTLHTYCDGLSPGPLTPVLSPILSIPPFTITVLFLKSKPDHVPRGLKFLHWLLNANKIKSEILSREC